jgi:hypothetical protein
MQNLCQMLYASGSGDACEGLQPCYVRTVVYCSGPRTFSVHGALRISAIVFTVPLGQKKYLILPCIKQLSPDNNCRLTFITDSVNHLLQSGFLCFPRQYEISRVAPGTAVHNLGIGGLL